TGGGAPGARRTGASGSRASRSPGGGRDDEATPPRGTRVPPPPPVPVGRDAWAVLGLSRDVSLDEARKVFRALVTQYHPDKVAHLAPEFHELAERRTREILEAWEEVERTLAGGG
ncbi:J domain-containing protein, partial [Pyxidicoccus sp. 3LG]